MNTNKQMSLEDFKKAVEKDIMMSNNTTVVKNGLMKMIDDNLEIYLDDNFTLRETVQALQMGY